MITAKPHHCEEAALGLPFYAPCNQPATWIVGHRNAPEIAMCTACAWHNLKNRGAITARSYDPNRYERHVQLIPSLSDIGAWLDNLPMPVPYEDPYTKAQKRYKAARLGVMYNMGEVKAARILGQYPLPNFDEPLGKLDL